ncbi:bifunctional diguanylate cyclase/phosphodiesterase [Massilia sp. DWR3-1-1]|uniref:bifunctional diguanylate cyclase/phosphodiesterase n=1 Tax=Massilia sp. DWR3-1-1 TaxID=2804559 RepID=UPI003CF05CE1
MQTEPRAAAAVHDAPPGSAARARRTVPASVLTALVLGSLVTALLSVQTYRLETEKSNSQFARRAELRIRLFEHSVRRAVEQLQNVNRLFATSRVPISEAQFHEVAGPLLVQQSFIRSFVFHRYVMPAERARFEAAMRDAHPGFTISEVRDGKLQPTSTPGPWLVVQYYEPLPGNESVLGYDAWSNPQLRQATESAIDSGQPRASAPRQSVLSSRQRGVEGKVFAVLMPLYRRGEALDTAAARRQALIGESMAGFHANTFARQVFDHAGLLNTPDTHINIYAAAAPDEAALVMRYGAAPPRAPALAGLLSPAATVSTAKTFDFAGTPWLIVVSRERHGLLADHGSALIVLGAGFALTLLSAAYLRVAAARARLIEATVKMRTAQLQLTSSELQLRNSAIEASANAIFITSAHAPAYCVEYVNPAFTRITGYAAQEIIGQPFGLLDGADVHQPGLAQLRQAMAARRQAHTTVRSYCKDGSMYWNDINVAPVRDDDGQVRHFVHVNYDVTETRRYQEQLEIRANFDPLTGLANRNLLQDRVQQAICYASRLQREVWVAFIDLDRFKFVNDSAGHRYGDALLKMVGERIDAVVRAADTVGRLGGDEFVVVLPQYEVNPMTVAVIEQVLARMAAPFQIEEKEFFVSCSIGISVFPHDGKGSETLLMHADRAMYRAKEMGGNNYQFFSAELNTRSAAQLRIEGALRHALARQELLLHYQPQVDLASGAIVGAEALLRWQHPELGMVMPGDFIGLAEQTGLIVPIGAWVLRSACRQGAAWERAGMGKLRVAVNLSSIQFSQHDIAQTVAEALAESGLDPRCLEIELTEGIVMQNVERTISTLHQLKGLGVQISLDDFGTGYSSLAYLKRFPIDVIKIDQSFVRDIANDPDDALIVISIITLAHKLRLKVIAEGVETAAQLAFLRDNDCDEIQGYYFSKPLPAPAIGAMLAQGKRL